MLIPRFATLFEKSQPHPRGEELPPETARQLSAAYGLQLRSQKQITRRDQVHDTSTYLFETSSGKIILREHVQNVDCDRLLYEHTVLEQLRAHQLPVACPRPTRNGETFFVHAGKFYTFFEFISGYQLHQYYVSRTEKLRHIRAAAEALGRFHRALEGFTPKGKRVWRNGETAQKQLAEYHAGLARQPATAGFPRFFADNYSFLSDTLAALHARLHEDAALPRTIIHEDFGPYNLLFQHGHLSGILDLMDAHWDWKAKDVIYALFIFSLTRKGYYNAELVKLFMQSYQRFGALSVEEVEALPALFCYKRLNELPFYLTAMQAKDGQEMKYENLFAKFVAETKWHQSHAEELRAQLRPHVHPTSNGLQTAKAEAPPPPARLKILTIASLFPYPPDNGTKIPTYHRLRELAQNNDVTLLCICPDRVTPEQIAEIEKYCTLRLFHITPAQASLTLWAKARRYLKSLKRRVPYYYLENLSAEAQHWLHKNILRQQFDVVEAADDNAAFYVRPEWPCLKVVVMHSVAATALRKQMALEKRLGERMRTFAYWWVLRNHEKRMHHTFDLCAMLTKDNERELLALNPKIPAKNCLTNGVDLEYFSYQPPQAQPQAVCFVGRMDYAPNIDAVVYFAREVLPLVRESYPQIKFQIVGSKPAPEVLALAQIPGVEVTGYVEDIRPYLRNAGITAIPTRMGGGILNKILEALALGVPVVTCSVSVEGLDIEDGRELFVGDTPEVLAHAVLRLLQEPRLRETMAQQGRRYVERHHQWSSIIANYEREVRMLLGLHTNRVTPAASAKALEANFDTYKTNDVVAVYAKETELLPAEKTVLNMLRSRLPSMNVLDIGVGGGRTTLHFAQAANKYVGVDYSPEMITVCRERFAHYPSHVSFDVCDVRNMRMFAEQSFDFIFFSYNGLDYISHEERLQSLAEIHRVGKRGGYFCFSTHNLQTHPRLFALSRQFRLNPKQTLKNLIAWYKLNYRHNQHLQKSQLEQMTHAMLNDGVHEYRLQTYYITPQAQLEQLQPHFANITVFAGNGEEIVGERALATVEDPWLYYLGEIK